VGEQGENTIAFGPVGLAGCALLLLGILKRSRFIALVGLAGVVADVTWGQPRADVDREIELLRYAGVRWIRANVNWAGLEPDRKGEVDEWLLAMEKTSICGLGQASPFPVRNAMRWWPELFAPLERAQH